MSEADKDRLQEECHAALNLISDAILSLRKLTEKLDREYPPLPPLPEEHQNSITTLFSTLGLFRSNSSTSHASSSSSEAARAHAAAHYTHRKILLQHRTAIVDYLAKQLLDVSGLQKQLQEKRLEQTFKDREGFISTIASKNTAKSSHNHDKTLVKRQSSTTNTATKAATNLLGNIIQTTSYIVNSSSVDGSNSGGTGEGGGWEDDLDFILEKAKQDQLGPSKPLNNSIRTTKTSTTTTTTTNTNTTATTTASVIDDDGDEDDEDSAFLASLSPEQRMQLESENDVILSQLESTTDQVQRVAQTLGQIGDLHNQLSRHLGMQLETIESVYQDSYMAAGYMEDANAYLRKADKNFGDSSYWVFIFLVVASLVLLFLDWYGS